MKLRLPFPRALAKTPRACFRATLAVVCGVGLLLSTAEAAQFGTRCQKKFENGWQDTLHWAYAICGGLNDKLDDANSLDFYYDLSTSHCGFSSCDASSSAGGVDTVDLFYVATHGGVGVFSSSGTGVSEAALAMHEDGELAYSSLWRYGDDNDEVAIFSQYACETLTNRDGTMWNRWDAVFRGGVYVVTGSHEDLYGSITVDEVGRDYATGLQKGKSVRRAWFDGNSDWFHNQDLKVMAVGSSAANCENRRDGIKWTNFSSYARVRDADITHWCAVRITG